MLQFEQPNFSHPAFHMFIYFIEIYKDVKFTEKEMSSINLYGWELIYWLIE